MITYSLSQLLTWEYYNYTLKSNKYVCITTHQPDTKSHPNPNPNPNTKQHAVMSKQPNFVTCPTH